MERKKDKKLRNYEVNKSKIFKAFSDYIYKKGVDKLSLREIAKLANMNPALIYYYFKNKENLIIEYLECLSNRIIGDVEKISNSLEPADKKLHKLHEVAKKSIATKDQIRLFLVFISLWTLSKRFSQSKKILISFYDKLSGVIEKIIEEGEQEGKFIKANKESLAVSLIAFVQGMGIQRNLRKNQVDLKKHFDFFFKIIKKTLIKNYNECYNECIMNEKELII